MIISGLAKSSLIDFPGLVSCVLFVPGCNYDCFYCHNRGLIDGTHEVMDDLYVMEFLEKRKGILDGVVITGGEPTLQPGLAEFGEKVRAMGYKLKLDTNGSRPEVVETLIKTGQWDYFAVDYKAPSSRYREICGGTADAEPVLRTIRLLLDSGADFEVRTTVVPQLSGEDLTVMSREFPAVPRYVLKGYRKPEKFRPEDRDRVETAPYPQSEIDRLADSVRQFQPNTVT